MKREEIEKIAKEENNTFLKISRVPIQVKDVFIQISEGEFVGDYGMCLKWCIEQALEYQRVKEVLLDKEFMAYIFENKPKVETQIEQKEVTETKDRKTFGSVIEEKRREEGERG
jgi:hypothetical protein